MTGDGILHRCWIVLILPCGTFHTVGYVKLWKDGMTGPVLFMFPKETSVLLGKRVSAEMTPFQHINAWLQTVFFGRFYVSPQISRKNGKNELHLEVHLCCSGKRTCPQLRPSVFPKETS